MLSGLNLPELSSREEMLELLLSEEYGYLPPKPQQTEFDVFEDEKKYKYLFAGNARKIDVNIKTRFDGKSFDFPCEVFVPRKEGRYPFFVYIAFKTALSSLYVPYEEILDEGFGIIKVCYTDITSDDNDFTNGLAGVLYPDGKRSGSDAGKISMWAWAAQRAMDFLETQDYADLSNVTVCGHSRLGKTALLAGATDTRFACAYSNNSGCSGAALSRGKSGERVGDICKNFPFWFCENYRKYSGKEDSMPFDQHFLLASVAPRLVYVASADEDHTADPRSEFLGCLAASPAFETGLVCDKAPAKTGDTFHSGDIGYHLRAGKHFMSRYDWIKAIEFIKTKKS